MIIIASRPIKTSSSNLTINSPLKFVAYEKFRFSTTSSRGLFVSASLPSSALALLSITYPRTLSPLSPAL
jgi:hypothetical protein